MSKVQTRSKTNATKRIPATVIAKKAYKVRRKKNPPKDVGVGKPISNVYKINYKGKPTVQTIYRKGNYTRDEIMRITTKISKDAKAKGVDCEFSVSLLYNDHWAPGYFYDAGDQPRLFSYDDYGRTYYEDQETYKAFAVYMLGNNKYKKYKGGYADGSYDCLYDCLVQLVPYKMDKHFKDAIDFKMNFLGLNRCDLVDMDLIPLIEDKIEMRISITSGDTTRTSTKEFKNITDQNIEIKLKLKNDHYTIDCAGNWKARHNHIARKPMIYEKKGINDMVRVFTNDENGVYKISSEELDKIMKDYKSEYILIKEDNFKCDRHDPRYERYQRLIAKASTNKLKWAYNDFTNMANELITATNGVINMYKTGNIPATALHYFNEVSKAIQPEEILSDEAMWIRNSSMGSLIWAKKYKGKGYKYDVTSFYSSIMADHRFQVPIKRGTFKSMTGKEFKELTYILTGIYRCEIIGDAKCFKKNPLNYYTHFDLTTAKELGLSLELIVDDKPNFLHYEATHKIAGNKLFGKFVEFFFDLKKKNIKGGKLLLNCLWGRLVKQIEMTFYVDESTLLDVYTENTITEIKPSNEDPFTAVVTMVSDKSFVSNYARLGPFLLSNGRREIYRTMEPNIDDVVRVHTDGWICSTKMKINTGIELGDIKYEGYCSDVEVLNCNKIIGEFEI